ncbi:hypothetical protein [Cellulomonas cellasea]|uniref:Peptidase S1 domain-containing protein n=1 Tax=Cellulomonas cellasea TaxID=43670 RepID=A0A7W4YCE5_9CELL|nr:hypothetical protein [Cellulomonas cellasea]MBB2924653.1 hypothetical protein [Cellulomonas cellasea]
MTDAPGAHFETPDNDRAAQSDDSAQVRFQAPPKESAGNEQAALNAGVDPLAGVPTQVRDAHEAVQEALRGQSAERASGVRAMSLNNDLGGIANVEAVAIGLGEPGDGPPGEPTLTIFVAEQSSARTVREQVVDGLGVGTAADLPLTVRRSGQFEAQPHTFRIRPAPGGVSIGHPRVTAGTLGCLAIGRSAPHTSRLMLLSNNHVIANSNDATFGDSILQPGRYDSGTHPDDQIAILDKFVPIQYGGAHNYVDAAVGWCWPDRVRKEMIYPSGGGFQLYRIGSAPIYPQLGWTVGKSGRTTQLTQGQIVATNWSGWVNYGTPGQAFFVGQMVVQSASGNFSAGGDSGSVIWGWWGGLPPVGLLFAGGGGYTIASPMPWVTYLLDLNLYT